MEDNKEIEKDNINVEENQNSVVSELKEAIKEQAIEEEKPQSSNFTLRKILGGDFLSSEMLKKTDLGYYSHCHVHSCLCFQSL